MKCPHCGKDIPLNRSIMDLKDIMAAKQKMADRYRHRYCLEVAGGVHWTSKHFHLVYRELMKQIREINEKIANMKI